MCTCAGVTTTAVRIGRFLALGVAFCFVVGARPIVGVELCPPPAIQKPQSSDHLVFKSRTELVVLDVTVTDGSRRYVKGLRAEDFSIFEDGVEQKPDFFREEALPLDIFLLLDTSSSMHFRIDAARQAALGLVRSLSPGDRVAVVGFDDDMVTLVGIDGESAEREAAIESAGTFGMTRLYDAIDGSLKSIGRPVHGGSEERRAALIVFSDGDDTASEVSFDSVRQHAGRSDVAIYAVMPLGGPQPRAVPPLSRKQGSVFRPDALQVLSRDTGGTVFTTAGNDEFAAIYKTIGDELRQQYCLAYQPSNPVSAGGFRTIAVRMARPGLHARTRTGYYANQ